MERIKKYKDFLLEKSVKDIKVSINDLLDTINHNELNLHTTLGIDDNVIKIDDEIDDLYDNSSLIKSLKKKKLKKSQLENTKDSETLLDDNYVLKFFFIYGRDEMELEEPRYIVVQFYNKEENKNSPIMLFENTDSINDFYELLTNKTIDVQKGNKEYVYKTSNSGNNWELKNPNNVNKKFRQEMDFEEMDDLLKDKKTKYDVK
jgi:hypothetical protein